MSYTKRQRNRKKRQIFRITIVMFIFLYLLFRSVPSLLANSAKTVLPEKAVYVEKIKSDGVVIKHETIVRAKNSGELIYTSDEGERLAAGREIASINSLNDTSHLKQELSQIEASIKALQDSTKETSMILNEKEKVNESVETLIYDLQDMINKGNYNKIYLIKEQLAIYEDKAQDISFSNTLVGQSLDSLESRKKSLEEEIKKNHLKYYANHAGIISYELDGYEEIFVPKEFENYTYENLGVKSNLDYKSSKLTVNVDEPFCKIIDNFQWYIALKIENLDDILNFEENQRIRINFEGKEEELEGKIITINTSDSKAVIVAEFNIMLHEFYNIRFPKVEIVKLKKEGYKIPTKAIVDNGQSTGVFIKDKSGIVKFKPVDILGADSNYTYLDIDSVGLYDEVFLNPSTVKEGQILN